MTNIPTKKILIVDDDLAMRRLLEVCMRTLPADQISVGDGMSALEVMRRETIDLVVSDFSMPGISGIELVRSIRADEALREIPVMLLSSMGDPALPSQADEAGVQAYFMKPFSPAQVIATARRLLSL
jgi:two-component system chemotaxis response regulator CheY